MKYNLLLIITSFIFCQTNITTPMGSTGFGVWMTAHQPFKGQSTDISLLFDLHLPFGLEISLGKSVNTNVDYSFNQLGVAYDVKLYDWGSKVYGKRFDIEDYDFQGEFEKEELGLEIYKRGRKLNSFLRFSHFNYNNLGFLYDSYVTVGGIGRMTRLLTIGFGIRMPLEQLFHMRYSDLEITMGTSF
jgi:hypothetical protein